MKIHDNLSGALGWVSIACWIVVYSPQIYENYSLQSGEGLSILFVVIWLLGDACNLVGAIMGGLLPTVVLLGLYYSACDLILLAQIFYYRWKRSRMLSSEEQPLFTRSSQETHSTTRQLILQYTAALLFVFGVGVAAWLVEETTELRDSPPQTEEPRWGVQALGWTSATLYLGARLPQILKNFKTRCEGLSPALFFFAIFGNATYSLSICAKSVDPGYLILNAGWLAGSALTVFLDAFVVCQIFYYRKDSVEAPVVLISG